MMGQIRTIIIEDGNAEEKSRLIKILEEYRLSIYQYNVEDYLLRCGYEPGLEASRLRRISDTIDTSKDVRTIDSLLAKAYIQHEIIEKSPEDTSFSNLGKTEFMLALIYRKRKRFDELTDKDKENIIAIFEKSIEHLNKVSLVDNSNSSHLNYRFSACVEIWYLQPEGSKKPEYLNHTIELGERWIKLGKETLIGLSYLSKAYLERAKLDRSNMRDLELSVKHGKKAFDRSKREYPKPRHEIASNIAFAYRLLSLRAPNAKQQESYTQSMRDYDTLAEELKPGQRPVMYKKR